jgi:hypothetical protein
MYRTFSRTHRKDARENAKTTDDKAGEEKHPLQAVEALLDVPLENPKGTTEEKQKNKKCSMKSAESARRRKIDAKMWKNSMKPCELITNDCQFPGT